MLNSPYEILRHGGIFYIVGGGNQWVLSSVPPPPRLAQLHRSVGKPNAFQSSWAFPNALTANGNVLAVSDHTNTHTMFF